MWFYLDEWDFLANRTAFNVHDLFRAHNEHWVTLPVLVYRGMWWIFGLNSYRPYQLLIVLAHLGAALLVRTVMRRVGVRPWTATVVAVTFVFFGSGYQNIVLPFQITLVGSLVFGFVQLLLATHDGPLDKRDFFALAAGLAALMCSGVGVSMVVAVGVAVLLARGGGWALMQTVPLGLAYLLWYRWIGHVGYNGYRAKPGQVASFVRSLIAAVVPRDGPRRRARRGVRCVARRRAVRRVEAARVDRLPAARRDAARAARGRDRVVDHHRARARRHSQLPGEEPLPAPGRGNDAARARCRGRRDPAALACALAHGRGVRGVPRHDSRKPQRDRRLHAPADREGPGAVPADDARRSRASTPRRRCRAG